MTKIYVSGSILKKQTLDKCRNTFKNIAIYNVYGLSEAGPRVAAQHANVQNENSVGSAISGVEIKIVDEDGQSVPIEEIGLIHIKTPSIFAGYVSGNKSLTSKLEGWHNTGDIGYFDNRNELHIVDRADDVIIIGAHKIYPTQIEQSIMEVSDIQECTVVTANNATGKEILCCIYVSTNDVQTDIKNHLNKYFIKYEIPQLFIKVERIPKTSNGKTSRKQISAIITQILNDNTSNNYAYLFNLQTHK